MKKWWNKNKGMIIALCAIFTFFAFVNWNINPGEWNGFSRFAYSFISLVIVLNEKG